MYYSEGTYEALSRPVEPKRADGKNVYIVGSGIAGLSAACFLMRDAGIPGERIHILEKNPIPGGAMDGYRFENIGFVCRGNRGFDLHDECLWDLLRSVPSPGNEGMSVLDDFYRMDKKDPNYSLCRVTGNRGEIVHTEGRFNLSDRAAEQVMSLFLTREEALQGKKISDVFGSEVMNSNFWLFIRTMFGFESWHGALEMKRCLGRYIHQIGGIPDLKSMRYTRYNQYESIILPLTEYLKARNVDFDYGVRVVNVVFDCGTSRKIANRIDYVRDGQEDSIDLTDGDYVLITNGGCVENTGMGTQTDPAAYNTAIAEGGGWDMWRKIAEQDTAFGHPDVFCTNPDHTNWVSATVTTSDREIIQHIKKVCKRDPFSGKTVSGGLVTAQDSSWLLNWMVGRQPQFASQEKDQVVIWVCGMHTDRPGDYIGKTMKDCSGAEICEEWLYHIGVPEDRIRELAEERATSVPVVMPFVTSALMPRSIGDRPKVVPDGAVNFAFLGQYAETERDTAFTTEYSVRTAMEAVYTLFRVERGVPEVWGGCYDVRYVMDAAVRLLDGRKPMDMKLGFFKKRRLKKFLKRFRRTELGDLLREHDVI